jgi:hypothetical protein
LLPFHKLHPHRNPICCAQSDFLSGSGIHFVMETGRAERYRFKCANKDRISLCRLKSTIPYAG